MEMLVALIAILVFCVAMAYRVRHRHQKHAH